jgi:ferritin-like metal-binding protein YciE
MAKTPTLHDAFIEELQDAYDAEKQLTKARPKLAKASTSPDLRQAFENHLEETKGHVRKLERVFETSSPAVNAPNTMRSRPTAP